MKFGTRELIFVVLMLGLVGGSWHFVFNVASQKREAMQADIEIKQQALNNLRQATTGIDDMNTKIDELQQAIHFFESRLPQEKEVDRILEDVTEMVNSNGLRTHTFRTLRIERSSHYNEQPIQMTLSGDFNGFYAFLLDFEKLPRITRLTQMDLERISSRDGEMQAQITLSIFFEPDGGRETMAGAR